MNKTTFFVLICLIFTVQLYGVSLETFKATSHVAGANEPVLLGEAVPFTADDGTLFYLQEVNSLYLKQKTSEEMLLKKYLSPGGPDGPTGPEGPPSIIYEKLLANEENAIPYALLCENRDHILW